MTSENHAFTLMRSVLIFPANVARFAEKAPSSGADAICFDLEDAVPPAEKDAARQVTAAFVGPEQARHSTLVRINGVQTGLAEDDLVGVVADGLDGIILPKADSPAVVERVDHYLTVLERERAIEAGRIAILPLVETAAGILAAERILASSPRVTAALLGAEDLAADLGVERTRSGDEVRWARARFVVACHAAGVLAIDTPETDIGDADHLESELALARSLGYQGKLCIHPSQVPAVNRAFAPTQIEVEEARALVETFEREALASGRASIQIRGRMVDTPIYQRARRLLERAQAIRDE
jgi:citrate lyase subunit beta/citryl-CoA lyase